MKVYQHIDELIGKTPLIELVNIEKELGLAANIIAKLEYFNPAGSVKDRVAKEMIEDLENRHILKEGATIIEPTSGNTGIGLCSIAASKGYKAIIIMPDTMSIERIKLMKAYGAEVILTPGALGMQGSVAKANELVKEIPNSVIAGQFVNPVNPLAHEKTTGPEIYEDMDGKVDIFVAGIGTGGTISGAGRYLKKQNPYIKVAGVEPASSPLISKGQAGPHKIQGIGANFIPDNLDKSVLDEVVLIENEEAFTYARMISNKEGILVGISSGAALAAAVKLAKRQENAGKNIVVIFPDTGERYLSTELFK